MGIVFMPIYYLGSTYHPYVWHCLKGMATDGQTLFIYFIFGLLRKRSVQGGAWPRKGRVCIFMILYLQILRWLWPNDRHNETMMVMTVIRILMRTMIIRRNVMTAAAMGVLLLIARSFFFFLLTRFLFFLFALMLRGAYWLLSLLSTNTVCVCVWVWWRKSRLEVFVIILFLNSHREKPVCFSDYFAHFLESPCNFWWG